MFKVIRTLVYGKFVNALSPLLVEGFQRILPGTFVMQVGRSEKVFKVCESKSRSLGIHLLHLSLRSFSNEHSCSSWCECTSV